LSHSPQQSKLGDVRMAQCTNHKEFNFCG
jgi:hypothetical protein